MRRFATHRVEDPLSELRSEIRILTDQIRESADSEAAKELVHKVDFLLDTLARETQKRRQNWNSLEDREDLLRGLVSTADTFFLIGPDGRFLDVGEGTSASLGYSRSELLDMYLWDVTKRVDDARFREIWERAEAGETVDLEGLHSRNDGSKYEVRVRACMAPPEKERRSCWLRPGISAARSGTDMSWRG